MNGENPFTGIIIGVINMTYDLNEMIKLVNRANFRLRNLENTTRVNSVGNNVSFADYSRTYEHLTTVKDVAFNTETGRNMFTDASDKVRFSRPSKAWTQSDLAMLKVQLDAVLNDKALTTVTVIKQHAKKLVKEKQAQNMNEAYDILGAGSKGNWLFNEMMKENFESDVIQSTFDEFRSEGQKVTDISYSDMLTKVTEKKINSRDGEQFKAKMIVTSEGNDFVRRYETTTGKEFPWFNQSQMSELENMLDDKYTNLTDYLLQNKISYVNYNVVKKSIEDEGDK